LYEDRLTVWYGSTPIVVDPGEPEGTLADERDTGARAQRSDAALMAQYIHDLSERHGADLEREPDGDALEEDG
jgi:hypothetical protein